MTRIIAATRERFLLAITAQLSPDRIAEIHFFPGIIQGGVESGVAVVAATLRGQATISRTEPSALEVPLGVPDTDPSPYADEPADRTVAPVATTRFTVFSAHYRLTLKGPDRGNGEVTIVEEADAPLITVETVVRGVQRRSGDVEDPERMDGDEIRALLDAVTARP